MNYLNDMKKAEENFEEIMQKLKNEKGLYFYYKGSTRMNMKNLCISFITSEMNYTLGEFEDTVFDVDRTAIEYMEFEIMGKRHCPDYYIHFAIQFANQREQSFYYSIDYPSDLEYLAVSSIKDSGNVNILINTKILNGYYANSFVNRENDINPLFRQHARIIFSGNPLMIKEIKKF